MFQLVLISLACCCGIMAIVWLWAFKIKNASIVDVFWSYNFPVIAIILFHFAPGYTIRKIFICGMVLLAGARLGSHLAKRVFAHLDEEEGRYKQLRKEWAPNSELRFFFFFQFQAISNVILALPFFIIASNTTKQMALIEYIGFGLWLISVLGETMADLQLDDFKKNQNNLLEKKVCQSGLWNYSRHPNYFFQSLMWVSYFIFALGSPYGYLAILSPAIILYLLLNVTGIPATEEQCLRSKGDAFRAYQQTTSAFIPWFKSNDSHLEKQAQQVPTHKANNKIQ